MSIAALRTGLVTVTLVASTLGTLGTLAACSGDAPAHRGDDADAAAATSDGDGAAAPSSEAGVDAPRDSDASGDDGGAPGPVDAVIAAMPAGSWKELPSTHMADVCPPPYASYACGAVMLAWSGGAYDPEHDQLFVTGGHNCLAISIAILLWLINKNCTFSDISLTRLQ